MGLYRAGMTSPKPTPRSNWKGLNGEPDPLKGDIVHYVAHGTPVRPDGSQAFRSECVAAIVTGVADPDGPDDDLQRIHLFVISDKGVHFQRNIPLSDHHAHQNGGTWHWYTQCANA